MHRKYRYAQMAEALGISERLLKNWVRDRVIPFTKIKRVVLFDPVRVEAALERFERQPRSTTNPGES
jgi:excisionase family DNA binding protein